jgi:seryl-tRNA(Sec) selenium transferase
MADPVSIVVGVVSAPATIAAVKAWERWAARRAHADASALGLEAEAHRECREEVGELRTELDGLRVSVSKCESKHESAQREVGTLRSVVDVLVDRITRLEHPTDRPPPMEPAE